MISEGAFSVFDNKNQELVRIGKGSCFGELALLRQVSCWLVGHVVTACPCDLLPHISVLLRQICLWDLLWHADPRQLTQALSRASRQRTSLRAAHYMRCLHRVN